MTEPPDKNLVHAKPAGAMKMKVPLMEDEDICWDMKDKGFCPRLLAGGHCLWRHDISPLKLSMGPTSGALASAAPSGAFALPSSACMSSAIFHRQQYLALTSAAQSGAFALPSSATSGVATNGALATPSSANSVVQNIDATNELPDVEGKTLDAPDFVEPPEHLVGAIAGSMRMKRFLEVDMGEGDQEFQRMDVLADLGSFDGLDEPLPKKRRLVTIEPDSLTRWQEDENEDAYLPYTEEEDTKIAKITKLLTKWKVADNYTARYVLETLAYLPEIDELTAQTWFPDPSNTMDSIGEQILARILNSRGVSGLPMFSVDPATVFSCKWDLEPKETEKLEKLDWKELKYVIDCYDGTATIDHLVDASKAELDPYTAPLPGMWSHMRTLRLELIDGASDALVLGDANLSFSALLAQHRADLGHTGKIIATTFEDFTTLSQRYKELAKTIKSLLNNEAQIWHGVDCTRLAVDPRFHGFEESFGAVYFNFPHAGAVRGFFDQHPFVNWRHSNLMALFFRAISYFVKPGAIVKVSSNATARGVQSQQIIMAAEYSEFIHVETFPFTEWALRRYHRSYGDKRDQKMRPDAQNYKSQNAASDMVYCFRYAPSGQRDSMGVPIKQPPEICDFINNVSCCTCGYITHKEMILKRKDNSGQLNSRHHFLHSGAHKELAGKEKRKMVLDLYQRFLTEASGVHMGFTPTAVPST